MKRNSRQIHRLDLCIFLLNPQGFLHVCIIWDENGDTSSKQMDYSAHTNALFSFPPCQQVFSVWQQDDVVTDSTLVLA